MKSKINKKREHWNKWH